jgi:hypothetical protein
LGPQRVIFSLRPYRDLRPVTASGKISFEQLWCCCNTLRFQAGEWNEDDFDVLADGAVVGRIFKANASPVGASWMWTLDFWHHEDRSPTHGYEATREAAMAAFAKSWRRE